jgi:kynurenine formamidase
MLELQNGYYRCIDLTHTVHPDIPTWDLTCGYYVKTMRDYRHCPGEFKFRSQALDIRAGAGTHIDAPSHCFEKARNISDLRIEELIRPCVVIDCTMQAKHNDKYKFLVADIENFEQKYGMIPDGAFVLFYTGWSCYWNEPYKYHNNFSFPSISAEVAHILRARNIAGLGIDTLSPDCDETGSWVHAIILGADKYIVENIANAGSMPATGAYIMIMPLKVQEATESPIRLIGMVPESLSHSKK